MHAAGPPPRHLPRRLPRRHTFRRLLARLVLVASIAPVIAFGPALVRAPMRLLHELAVVVSLPTACAQGIPHLVHEPSACAARRGRSPRPAQVRGVRILARTSASARIGWRRVRGGRYPVAYYRVWRDGKLVGHTRKLVFTVRVSPTHKHRIQVAAVDDRGHAGPASRTLQIGVWHGKAHSRPRPGANRPTRRGEGPGVPGALSVSEVGDQRARVWWVASHAGSARIIGYRVWRDGGLVGQTQGTTLQLTHLSTSRTYLIAVSAVDAAHRESARTPALRLTTTHTPPTAPALLSALRVTDTSATLSWRAGAANSGTLAGYLLFKDGEPDEVVHGQITTVALASERRYTFTVRSLDSDGYLSAPAPAVQVFTTHTRPSTPRELVLNAISEQSATVGWSPSTAVSGRIVGYRVFRNEIPVGQTSVVAMTLSSLAPATEYQVTVAAVDSLGAISEPTAPLAIRTAEPTPTHGAVQAYLLASTDESFDDLQAHYQQIGVVYPTYFDCTGGGTLSGSDDPLVTAWAHARQIAVMPRLNCQNPPVETAILTNIATRENLIGELAASCAQDGYQGIQIDFEGAPPSDREPFTAFITALAARLHAQGDKLSTVVTAKYSNVTTGRAAMYDDAALSGPSDYVFVLDWGLHWTTSAPGGLAEMSWFTRVADYAATMPNKNKFVLGMPLYGIDWPGAGGAANPGTPLEFDNVMALVGQYGAVPQWEPTAQEPYFTYTDAAGTHHTVWYTDQQSLQARVALAQSLGLGVGLWHLGSEDQSIWELPGLGG